jgi:hypothetical protein
MAQELSEQTRALVRSRIADYQTLTPEQQLREAIKVIAADFYIYCERNLMIQDKISGNIVPFKLNWAQKLLVERVMDDIAHGRPVRYIILKARQMGLSTVIEALGFWWTTTHKNIKTVIIAHETEASGNLYQMFKRYFDNSHPTFQPRRKYNNKKELVFDVDDTIKEEYKAQGKPSPGLGSEIKTLVAKEGKGRSATIHFFHGSEVAFWEAKADVVSSAIQAVPLAANTFAFLESTANGVGGFFYDEWQFAKKGESAFKPLFFAWHEHSEYEIAGEVSSYDDEEQELLAIFEEKGYPKESWDRKILWRREKKKEFRSDPKKFYQEYPKDDMEAFLSSGRPVFEIGELVKMEQIAQKAPAPTFGQILANPDSNSTQKFIFDEVPVNFQDQDPTPLKVWDLPEKGEKYTIGVDVSEGKLNAESADKKNDYSVIDITRVSDLKTVARWRGHIDPDLLGAVVFSIGTFYNTALVGVEINNHGLTTVQHLRNKFYRNLYMRETSEEHQFQERTALMGWRTDRKTKPIIINNLVQAIRENDIIDLDVVFIRECMTYVRDDQGHTNAQEGMYDDTVMAKAIALQLTNFNSINAEYAKENIHKPVKRNTNATRSNTTLETIAAGTVRRSSNVEAVQRRRAARAAHKADRRRG